jgi:hypothetical protein
VDKSNGWNYTYNGSKNRAIQFFSVASPRYAKVLLDMGVNEILISYHYFKKNPAGFQEIIEELTRRNGYFMLDSGVFTYLADPTIKDNPEAAKVDFWRKYIEEYIGFIEKNHKHIYCAANFDLDLRLGREATFKLNEEYFEPLHDRTNITYIFHANRAYDDPYGLKHAEYYAQRYDYIGTTSSETNDIMKKVIAIVRNYNVRCHGMAYTSYKALRSTPLFSIDSSTWLGGLRYGSTYWWDGANFSTIDFKKKAIRKKCEDMCDNYKINFEDLLAEKEEAVLKFCLVAWICGRNKYLENANVKLDNKVVERYRK